MNSTMRTVLRTLGLAIALSLLTPALAQRHYDTDILKETFGFDENTRRSVEFDELVQACPARDCIQSIDNPKFVAAGDAGFLAGDDLILGVVIDGDARAYPAKILDHHEIVNDTVGGMPIAITYCPLCGSGVAVSRVFGDITTEFGVSGILYNSDLVLYDRASNTLWSQIEGVAVAGSQTGTKLKTLPVTMARWSRWHKKHPAGQVLSTDTGFAEDYSADHYAEYRAGTRIYLPVSNEDSRVHPKTVVFGTSIGDQPVAVTEMAFKYANRIEARLAGRDLTLTMAEDGTVSIRDRNSQETWGTGRLFWFAWYTFNPSTELVQ